MPIPLKNNTVVGSILNISGTRTDAPNIANKCCMLNGMALTKGIFSFTSILSFLLFEISLYIIISSSLLSFAELI